MIFFGSERSAAADVVGPDDVSDDGANFSAGSFTVAEKKHNTLTNYNRQEFRKLHDCNNVKFQLMAHKNYIPNC